MSPLITPAALGGDFVGHPCDPVRPPEAGRSPNHPVRRRVWRLLTAWTVTWGLLHAVGAGFSWHFFSLGARLLGSSSPTSGGLHLYAAHPELQIGPLALVAAIPLTHLDAWQGRVVAILLLTAEGPLLLAALVRIRERVAPVSDPLVLVTGLCLLPVWTEVATHFAHLDDALALGALVLAGAAVQRGAAATTGLLLATATDCKPWALACAALLLALPSGQRLRGGVFMAGGLVLAWAPFFLADPGTMALSHFTIPNVPDSALNAIGVHAGSTPGWDRAAQLALGFGVAALAVRRGNWPRALLAVVCARLLLDPETYAYYTSGVLVGAALIDIHRPRRVFPMWTAAAALFYLAETPLAPILPAHVLGLVRAGYCLTVLAMIARPSAADTGGPRVTSAGVGRSRPAVPPGEWQAEAAVLTGPGGRARSVVGTRGGPAVARAVRRQSGSTCRGRRPVDREEPLWQPAWTSRP